MYHSFNFSLETKTHFWKSFFCCWSHSAWSGWNFLIASLCFLSRFSWDQIYLREIKALMFLPYNINNIQHNNMYQLPSILPYVRLQNIQKDTSPKYKLHLFLTWRFGEEDLLLMVLRFGRGPPLLSSDSVSQAELSRSWTLNSQQWVNDNEEWLKEVHLLSSIV